MVKPVKKFVGLANYAAIFRDPNSWKIAGNTAVYILVLLVLNFVLPYILSFILSAVIKRGQGFYKAVFFLPSVISLVVGSILYIWILNPISGPVATGIYVFITTIVQGLQYVFTPIKVVTQGGPNYASSNLIYMSYHEAFTLYRTGTSSAVSVITMVLFIVLLLLEFRFVEKGVYYEN